MYCGSFLVFFVKLKACVLCVDESVVEKMFLKIENSRKRLYFWCEIDG
jgi:hypothetical protein